MSALKVFIHTNSQQMVGALAAKYSFFKNSAHADRFDVEIINYDDYPILREMNGRQYLRKGQKATWHSEDLQSFSVLRFLPPQLMNYSGRAVVVDPDVFAVGDIYELLTRDMKDFSVMARLYPHVKKKKVFASSVMLFDCEKLKHWDWQKDIQNLFDFKFDYGDWIFLLREQAGRVGELESYWNDLDVLTEKTKLLHTTERLTQPWKTGLDIDFNMNLPKTPRSGPVKFKPINFKERLRSWLLGGQTIYGPGGVYQRHPEANVEEFIYKLFSDCMKEGFLDPKTLTAEIEKKNVRSDMFQVLNKYGIENYESL